MSRLVDDLLLLARSDRPDFLRVEPLDLDVLTQRAVRKGADPRGPALADRSRRTWAWSTPIRTG